jgi:putative membrane protein
MTFAKSPIMSNGFLGYNATFMLDLVVCALVLVVPILAASIFLVKAEKSYIWHRRLQLLLAGVLLFAVAAFELDVQVVHHGWQNIVHRARPEIAPADFDFIRKVLYVHLLFAISTPFLWAVTISLALPRFGNPPAPSAHSRWHKRLGWTSAIDLAMTSVTGLVFYYFAFVNR